MTEYYSYITSDKDRWDLISYKFYDTPFFYEEIINANPDIPITPELNAGIQLKIPVLENTNKNTINLPPWK